MKQWPKLGSKATFKGSSKFWFTNIVKDADELLEVGKEYTIKKLELASSWCAVILEEFPEHKFSLGFFDYDKDLTTQEVIKIKREYIENRCEQLMTEYEADSKKILEGLERKNALLKKWYPVLDPNNLSTTPLSSLVLLESEEQQIIRDKE